MIALVNTPNPDSDKSFSELAIRVISTAMVFGVVVFIVGLVMIGGSAAIGLMVRAFRWGAGF